MSLQRYLAFGLCAAALGLAACGSKESDKSDDQTTVEEAIDNEAVETGEVESLNEAVNGKWRSDANKARDAYRHPIETLEFFEIAPDDAVMEIWPGGGWYAEILAPYLKGDGRYIAAGFDPEMSEFASRTMAKFDENFIQKPGRYGDIEVVKLSSETGPLLPENSVDKVLTFRNIHNWMASGYAEKVFRDMYAALKPGGILGVVEHRLPSASEQDPTAGSGYVHEDFVKQLAEEAGFEFVASSEVNANTADTADHPYGVWTLPPTSRTPKPDAPEAADFDAAKYQAIGESDRMTLKFRKPLPEETPIPDATPSEAAE